MSVIDDFRQIAATGDLPPGYRWDSIEWVRGRKPSEWMGWCWGPNGANDWLPVRKMPAVDIPGQCCGGRHKGYILTYHKEGYDR